MLEYCVGIPTGAVYVPDLLPSARQTGAICGHHAREHRAECGVQRQRGE